MYAIAGVTGRTGSAVATSLLAKGKPVRALVHGADKAEAWKARGAEVVVVDLTDVAATKKALKGVEAAFLLNPPVIYGVDEQGAFSVGLAKAAAGAKVPHVVFQSSIGAEQAAGTGVVRGVNLAEAAWKASGVPTTFVRSAYHLENWAGHVAMARKEGVFPSFFRPDLRVPMVACRDVGEFAAEALISTPGGVLDVAGPVDWTAAEVAMALGNALGKTLQVLDLPTAGVVEAFTSMGMAQAEAVLYQELFEAYNAGRMRFQGPPRRGRTTPEQVFKGLLAA